MTKELFERIFREGVPPTKHQYPGLGYRADARARHDHRARCRRADARRGKNIYRRDASRGRRKSPGAHRLERLRQTPALPIRVFLQGRRRQTRMVFEIHQFRGARSALLGAARLRHHQRRPARRLAVGRRRHLLGPRRRPRRPRPGRMDGRAGVVQRQGRHDRRLVSGDRPVADRGDAAAAPGGDQSVGRLERHVPGIRLSWRHSRDVLHADLAEVRLLFGEQGGRRHGDDEGASSVRCSTGPPRSPTFRRSTCPPLSWRAGRIRVCTCAGR